MVHGLFKIERHDLGTLGGDLLLTAGRRTEADAIEEAEHGYNAKNHDDNDGNTVVIFMPKTLIYNSPFAVQKVQKLNFQRGLSFGSTVL